MSNIPRAKIDADVRAAMLTGHFGNPHDDGMARFLADFQEAYTADAFPARDDYPITGPLAVPPLPGEDDEIDAERFERAQKGRSPMFIED